MATKSEVIDGLEFLIQESHRIAGALTPEEWALASDMDGWKNTEVLAHVAGVGSIIVPYVQAALSTPAGSDSVGSVDIDALNAGLVAARKGKSPAELADECESGYRALIDYIKSGPDDLLENRVTAGGHKDVQGGELLMRMCVLHGLGHIYAAYSAVFFGGTP